MGFVVIADCYAQGLGYEFNYDFENNGDSWYGKTPKQNRDYYMVTQLPTQEGDDFCVNYESTLVHYDQGPALLRTQEQHTAYDFRFNPTSDCTTGSPPPPKPDFMFANGFE